MTDSPYSTLIKDFMPPSGRQFSITPVHRVIARGKTAELCYVPGKELGKDPEYWYLTKEGIKAVLGPTGMLKSAERLAATADYADPTTNASGDLVNRLELILDRTNAYGNFTDGDHNSLSGKPLTDIIDSVYIGIADLDFLEPGKQPLFDWDSAKLLSRFEDYRRLYNGGDIIPEYTDKMTLITLSNGCHRKCIYCPEPSPDLMVPYSEERINEEIALARILQLRYHSGSENLMDEGFLNTADLLQFHLQEWTDPLKIVGLFREQFPELKKIYSFMGVPSVIQTSQEYLDKLFNNAQGVNRVLVGIESADDATSRFLGKNETYADKREALLKLKEAGYKVKPIIQIGMVGEGFYTKDGDFVSSRQGLEATARLMAEFLSSARFSKKPDKVLISRYTPIEGTPLKMLHESGRLIKPYNHPDGADEDLRFLLDSLQKMGIDIYDSVELDYESALEGRTRNLAK